VSPGDAAADREPATAAAWSNIRRLPSSLATAAADTVKLPRRHSPTPPQVADRWHLMENASRAFLDAVRKSTRQIRMAIGATTINPDLLTAAERLQHEGYLRREEINAAVLALAKDGTPIKQIVVRLGHSQQLVRRIIRGERHDVFRTRHGSLEAHLPWSRIVHWPTRVTNNNERRCF
jgi:transposase